MLDIFMANHKPRAGFYLNMTFNHGIGNKEILLWCDGKSPHSSGKKNDDEDESEEVSAISKCAKSASTEEKELAEGIHKLQSDDYDYGQYRLWARMI